MINISRFANDFSGSVIWDRTAGQLHTEVVNLPTPVHSGSRRRRQTQEREHQPHKQPGHKSTNPAARAQASTVEFFISTFFHQRSALQFKHRIKTGDTKPFCPPIITFTLVAKMACFLGPGGSSRYNTGWQHTIAATMVWELRDRSGTGGAPLKGRRYRLPPATIAIVRPVPGSPPHRFTCWLLRGSGCFLLRQYVRFPPPRCVITGRLFLAPCGERWLVTALLASLAWYLEKVPISTTSAMVISAWRGSGTRYSGKTRRAESSVLPRLRRALCSSRVVHRHAHAIDPCRKCLRRSSDDWAPAQLLSPFRSRGEMVYPLARSWFTMLAETGLR